MANYKLLNYKGHEVEVTKWTDVLAVYGEFWEAMKQIERGVAHASSVTDNYFLFYDKMLKYNGHNTPIIEQIDADPEARLEETRENYQASIKEFKDMLKVFLQIDQ